MGNWLGKTFGKEDSKRHETISQMRVEGRGAIRQQSKKFAHLRHARKGAMGGGARRICPREWEKNVVKK